MFKFILVVITMMFFMSGNASATVTDPSLPYFITSDQVLAPGFVKPVSPFETYPHKMTGETMLRINGATTLTSHTMQVTQPDMDSCIAAMKRFVNTANDMGNIVDATGTNTKRKAYCTPAMQGAE